MAAVYDLYDMWWDSSHYYHSILLCIMFLVILASNSHHIQKQKKSVRLFLVDFQMIIMLCYVSLSPGVRCSRDYPVAGSSGRRRGRGGKRLKHQETIERASPGSALRGGTTVTPVPNMAAPPPTTFPLGPPTTSSSWPTSVGSQASLPSVPYPPGMLPLYPLYPPISQPLADPSSGLRFPLQNVPMAPQMVPPMMALVLPNYMFPQMNTPLAQPAAAAAATPATLPFYNPNPAFVAPFTTAGAGVGPVVASLPPSTQQTQMPTPTLVHGPRPPSRSSTPLSSSQREAGGDREGGDESMLLPSSRCSSPLNLLQLEEPPSSRLDGAGTQQTTPTGGQGGVPSGQGMTNQRGGAEDLKDNDNVSARAMLGFPPAEVVLQ